MDENLDRRRHLGDRMSDEQIRQLLEACDE